MAQQPTAKRLAQSQTGRATTTDIQSRVKTYEEACVSSLRTLNTAEATYWGGDPQKGYARSLEQLGPTGVDFIEPILASGKKDGRTVIVSFSPQGQQMQVGLLCTTQLRLAL